MYSLNDVIPPAVASIRSRNAVLDARDLSIVNDVFNKIDEYSFESCVGKIASIVDSYGNSGEKGRYIPLSLMQLIYYIIYKKKATQNAFFEQLKKSNVTKNHKIFENNNIYVEDFKKCAEYVQPDLLINYKGQKKDLLGEAIKNLAFQAGKYDKFIDVFGGSMAASLAVARKNNASHIYNDKDYGLCCLAEVLIDDILYLDLIKCLNLLKADLAGSDEWILLRALKINFNYEVQRYIAGKKGGVQTDEEENILSDIETDELIHQRRFYEWFCFFTNITRNDLAQRTFANGEFAVDGVTVDNKVILALAEVYLWSFTTRGTKELSPILRMYLSTNSIYSYKKNIDNTWRKFMNTDHEELISEIHSIMGNETRGIYKSYVECLDCRDLILKYSGKGMPLFYSDYPYLSAKGYSVGNWTAADTRKLIDLLVTSGGKFIFSCRASATKDASSNKSDEEYLKQNREIYNNVLDYFRKKGIRLWVARFSTKNMSFAEKLINNGETEIMITNFEIQDFTPKNRGVVETMSYVDFMQDIDKYLVK